MSFSWLWQCCRKLVKRHCERETGVGCHNQVWVFFLLHFTMSSCADTDGCRVVYGRAEKGNGRQRASSVMLGFNARKQETIRVS